MPDSMRKNELTMTVLMTPDMANFSGNVHGGAILKLLDQVAYACASRYSSAHEPDETGNIQAFERSGGRSLWKQADLYGRRVSAPAVYAGYVAVGDFEGYVHLLSPADGSIVARLQTDKSRVLVAPHVVNSTLLVQTESGGLHALAVK